MASICSFHRHALGYKFRARRRLAAISAVILQPGVARRLSICPVFGRWLMVGRWLRVPVRVRDIDLFGSGAVRVVFRVVRMTQLPRGVSHD